MTVHIHKPTRLPPFGRCIYCNASDENGPLTSEHVVPFFLGGNLEIDEASCRDCQKITTKIEGHCAYKVFHQYRHGVGIKSRRSIPQSIPVIFHTNAGPSVRQVPLGDQPQIMTLPIFPEPGMLEGRTPKQQMQPEIMTAWVSQAIEERFERSKREGDEGYSLDAEYDVDIFARFIAKIGIAAS
ncbi:MAG TPA: hypothetical protein DEA50_14830, partial [Parvularcula sp.]|nr:hypothetical protein [Parvularcula sp.]